MSRVRENVLAGSSEAPQELGAALPPVEEALALLRSRLAALPSLGAVSPGMHEPAQDGTNGTGEANGSAPTPKGRRKASGSARQSRTGGLRAG